MNSVPGLTSGAELPSLPEQELDGAVTSWEPGAAFMFSITVFETPVSLWRSWALVSENKGPDPSKTPLAWQKRPNIDIRQILLSSAGKKSFPASAPLEPDSLRAVKCWSSTNTWRKSVVWIYYWKKICRWLAGHANSIVATLIKYLIISSGT